MQIWWVGRRRKCKVVSEWANCRRDVLNAYFVSRPTHQMRIWRVNQLLKCKVVRESADSYLVSRPDSRNTYLGSPTTVGSLPNNFAFRESADSIVREIRIFEYLKFAFEVLVASRPTRDQLCIWQVGQLTKCAFEESADTPNAHLGRSTIVGHCNFAFKKLDHFAFKWESCIIGWCFGLNYDLCHVTRYSNNYDISLCVCLCLSMCVCLCECIICMGCHMLDSTRWGNTILVRKSGSKDIISVPLSSVPLKILY